jgi:hypothetical protein
MTPIGTPELVLLLVALGGMTAAATWAVIPDAARSVGSPSGAHLYGEDPACQCAAMEAAS